METQLAEPVIPDVFDVLDGCHREILVNVDKLTALVERLQAGALDEQQRSHARDVMAFFSGPAREHSYDEERHVFPMLLRCDDGEVRRAAATLCEDHAWIELCWLDIEPQLESAASGSLVSDVQVLIGAAGAFASITREHVALEEALLYPELRERLTPSTRTSISREIAARRRASASFQT